jgi:hypothetical protein
VRFWDASAIVPLLVREPTTDAMRAAYDADSNIVVWAVTPIEAWSAVARKRRDGGLRSPDVRAARQRLEDLTRVWIEVHDVRAVRLLAQRLLDTHALRAADAMQLGAALVVADGRPSSLPFLSLDESLVEVAEREGLRSPLPE